MKVAMIAILAALAATPTQAQTTALAFLADAPCGADGRVAPEDVVTALMKRAGGWSLEAARAWDANRLGDYARGKPLQSDAHNLMSYGPRQPGPNGLSAIYVGTPPAPDHQWLRYLNRDNAWFEVRCRPGEARAEAGDDDATGARWILGGGEGDAAKEFPDRDFAKVSYTADHQSDQDVISVDLYLGLPPFGDEGGPLGPWRPFVSYQRKTTDTDPLNDLAFGFQFQRQLPVGGGLYGSLAYETDDQFDSALYRGEVIWRPGSFLGCRVRDPDVGALRCTPYFIADHVSVQDAGDKAALVDKAEYTRIGAGLEIYFRRRLSGGASVEFGADYRFLEPLNGEVGQADQLKAKLEWRPGDEANFAFGLEYLKGEDASSLTPADRFMVYLGYRL